MTRSFYVGENVEKEDIDANYRHGVLNLTIPKKAMENKTEKNLVLKAKKNLDSAGVKILGAVYSIYSEKSAGSYSRYSSYNYYYYYGYGSTKKNKS